MTKENAVVIVTGASRGAGRGIAIALGSKGCTVYVTGRTQQSGEAALPGTIYETANAVTEAGGTGHAVAVDHTDDTQIANLFELVLKEQGRLDIVVNNAFAAHEEMTTPGNFWEKPIALIDMWQAGLRGAYVASHHAAKIMAAQSSGLIAFTSAPGARHYVFGPAYGVHKAGLDKMAADMAVDLEPFKVATTSIWMGALMTERLRAMIDAEPDKYAYLQPETMETPEFTGKILWSLYNDPELLEFSGRALIGAELGIKYGITDIEGRQPPSYRDRYGVYPAEQHPFVIR